MKILKGELKGRNLLVPKGVRPVSVRVKKSCFDILGQELENSRVLDLFAGSGALGIEAISLGAGSVEFNDSNRGCISVIKKNIAALRVESKAEVGQKDAFSAVKDFATYKRQFDLIFLDPPYHKGMLIKALQLLEGYDILAPCGYLIALCYSKDEFIEDSSKLALIVNRKCGQTRLLIYRNDEKSHLSRNI